MTDKEYIKAYTYSRMFEDSSTRKRHRPGASSELPPSKEKEELPPSKVKKEPPPSKEKEEPPPSKAKKEPPSEHAAQVPAPETETSEDESQEKRRRQVLALEITTSEDEAQENRLSRPENLAGKSWMDKVMERHLNFLVVGKSTSSGSDAVDQVSDKEL